MEVALLLLCQCAVTYNTCMLECAETRRQIPHGICTWLSLAVGVRPSVVRWFSGPGPRWAVYSQTQQRPVWKRPEDGNTECWASLGGLWGERHGDRVATDSLVHSLVWSGGLTSEGELWFLHCPPSPSLWNPPHSYPGIITGWREHWRNEIWFLMHKSVQDASE